MKGRFSNWLDAAVIFVAIVFALAHPSLAFLDGSYANGFYPAVQTTVTTWTNHVPFALGDALLVAVILAAIAYWYVSLRKSRPWPAFARVLLRTAAFAGFLYVWFSIAWGWNYDRPGLSTTLGYYDTHISTARFDKIEFAILNSLNAAAQPAHDEHARTDDVSAGLAAAQQDTAKVIGVEHAVVRTDPKHTILDPYFVAADITGMFMPFTYETYITSDVLWFEYPFTLEHEWGHAEGIARESDANFIASLATLNSTDPVLHYSGLLIVYAAMPRRPKIDAKLSKLVRADYAAMRERDKLHVQPIAFKLAWVTYDKYLKSQHVRTGVVNYTEYVRMLLGTSAGRDALARATGKAVVLR